MVIETASHLSGLLYRTANLLEAGVKLAFVFDGEPPSFEACLLYTSDAADDLPCVDLGGRRIIKKKNNTNTYLTPRPH